MYVMTTKENKRYEVPSDFVELNRNFGRQECHHTNSHPFLGKKKRTEKSNRSLFIKFMECSRLVIKLGGVLQSCSCCRLSHQGIPGLTLLLSWK
ncbi:hypothetical protein CEXT_541691 [Caerostris extrusa]|uniref:Uncharacterized protein n=1 Tax=Caerostris extrusa TaxID=172846 RepID=A0AAV4R8L5_CAEEX|nr:hypothetical protein CEXT_541691 [Caerostris extrusa]